MASIRTSDLREVDGGDETPAVEFCPPPRFVLEGRVGEGAQGVVYRAADQHEKRTVAIKVLANPRSAYRLLQEFNVLREIDDPNVVKARELGTPDPEKGQLSFFFTMDFVEGMSFTEWVGRAPHDAQRVRSAFRQLASGLAALHEKGKIHCDLKPSNVLVTSEGRVVIVDLGVAVDLEVRARPADAGTLPYAAPELEEDPPSEKSDWYAVGVMLHEVLAGRRPFDGTRAEIREAKRNPPSPPAVPGLEGLASLAADLLQPDPDARPAEHEVLRVLAPGAVMPGRRAVFVGRTRELAVMRRAFDEMMESDAPRVVFIQGRSGIGKTALVRRFRDEFVRKRIDVEFLEGRCLDRHSGAYTALDGLLAEMARHLEHMRSKTRRAMLPGLPGELRLFPPLANVDGIADGKVQGGPPPDQQERRRRAFHELKDLLVRVTTNEMPLVVYIDNLQWSDKGSAAAIEYMIAPPRRPKILLIASSWPVDNPVARVFRDLPHHELHEIRLGELDEADSLAVARAYVGPDPAAERIAEDSHGIPFLLRMLSRRDAREGAASVDGVIHGALERLSPHARKLLEVVALAGTPLSWRIAARVAGLPGEARSEMQDLQDASLISRVGDDLDELDLWHESVREVVTEGVASGERKRLHGELARVLTDVGVPPDRLVSHYAEAGDWSAATKFAIEAAQQAESISAFEIAAEYWPQALRYGRFEGARYREVMRSYAYALANGGQGRDAATVFSEAAEGAPEVEAREMRRLAVEQYLQSGWLDEGLRLARKLTYIARTPQGAFVGLTIRRVILAIRGFGFRERQHVPPKTLRRIDMFWSLSSGLAMQDHVRAASLQKHHTLLALNAGEPRRALRALSIEASFAAQAKGGARTVEKIFRKARELARGDESPETLGRIAQMEAGGAFFRGSWADALRLATHAEEHFRECTGMHWERTYCQVMTHLCLLMLGRFREMSEVLPLLVRSAQRRNDRFGLTHLAAYGVIAALATGDRALATRLVSDASSALPRHGYSYQHFWVMSARLYLLLYENDARAAFDRVERDWEKLAKSHLLRVQTTGAIAWFRRGFAALGVGEEAIVEAACHDIERREMKWAEPLAALLRAALDVRHGDAARARKRLAAAISQFEASGMAGVAAATKRRLGELIGGDEGATMIATADELLQASGVVDPACFANLLAPKFSSGVPA